MKCIFSYGNLSQNVLLFALWDRTTDRGTGNRCLAQLHDFPGCFNTIFVDRTYAMHHMVGIRFIEVNCTSHV